MNSDKYFYLYRNRTDRAQLEMKKKKSFSKVDLACLQKSALTGNNSHRLDPAFYAFLAVRGDEAYDVVGIEEDFLMQLL